VAGSAATAGSSAPRVVYRLDPADHVLVVGQRPRVVDRLGVQVLARRLHEARAAVTAAVAGGQRVGADDLDAALLLEEPPGAGDRAAGADARDEVRHPAVGRGPDLRAGAA